MSAFLIWFVAYALPAGAGYCAVKVAQRRWAAGTVLQDAVVIHGALLISIAISQYLIHSFGLAFPWSLESYWVFAYVGAIAMSCLVLGTFGLGYALSALIQQLTMLSVAFLLLPALPVYAAIILIVPIYALLHRMRARYDWRVMSLFLVWGVASVGFFALFHNIWVTAALHALFGATLIQRSVLYTGAEVNKMRIA